MQLVAAKRLSAFGLNYAVASAHYGHAELSAPHQDYLPGVPHVGNGKWASLFTPTVWPEFDAAIVANGLALIELCASGGQQAWEAQTEDGGHVCYGASRGEAAARAYVLKELGPIVSVPDVLVQQAIDPSLPSHTWLLFEQIGESVQPIECVDAAQAALYRERAARAGYTTTDAVAVPLEVAESADFLAAAQQMASACLGVTVSEQQAPAPRG